MCRILLHKYYRIFRIIIPKGISNIKHIPNLVSAQKTTVLPPETALHIAWGLSGLYSQNPAGRDEAQSLKQDLDKIGKTVDQANVAEKKYFSDAVTLIEAAERNLQIIIDGRDENFKEKDEQMASNQQNIQYFSQFTSDLQSLIPRIGSMTVGGGVGAITVYEIFHQAAPYVPSYVLPLIIAASAGIGYLLHGLVIIPIANRMFQKNKIQADYARNLYYDQYFERSRNVLSNLYLSLENCHLTYFQQNYNQDSDAQKVAERVIGVRSTMCRLCT